MGYTRQKKSDQTASTQAVNMARANISRFSKELKEADNPAYVPVTSEVEKIWKKTFKKLGRVFQSNVVFCRVFSSKFRPKSVLIFFKN